MNKKDWIRELHEAWDERPPRYQPDQHMAFWAAHKHRDSRILAAYEGLLSSCLGGPEVMILIDAIEHRRAAVKLAAQEMAEWSKGTN